MDWLDKSSVLHLQRLFNAYDVLFTGKSERRREQKKIDSILREKSVVYAKKSPRLPKVYQHTEKLRYRANTDYQFHSLRAQSSFPQLKAGESLTKVKPQKKVIHPSPPAPDTQTQSSVPPLPPSPSLLRRPNTHSSRICEEDDQRFHEFTSLIDLKALSIDDSPAKTLLFYNTHYPLILETLWEEDRHKFADRRSTMPILGPNLRQRGAEIGRRLLLLNMALDDLEEEMEKGEKFFTELRKSAFDPRKWPWNTSRYN